MPSKKEQKLRAKAQAAREQMQSASAAAQQQQNDGDTLGSTVVELLDKALGSNVLEDVKSTDPSKFNKGAEIFEFRDVMQQVFVKLENADRIKRDQDRAMMQGANKHSFSIADVGRMMKAKVEAEVAKVMVKVEDKQTEIDRLREELDTFKSQFPTKLDGAKEGRKIKLISEEAFDDLNVQVAGHDAQLKKLQQENTKLKTEIANIRAREVAASQNVQTLHTQVNTFQQTVASVPQGVTISSRLSTIEKDVQRLQNISSDDMCAGLLASRVKELENEPGDVKIQACSEESEALESKMTNVEQDVQRLKGKILGTQKGDTLTPKVQREIRQLDARISTVKSTVDYLHDIERPGAQVQVARILEALPQFSFEWRTKEEKQQAEKACGFELPGRIKTR